MKNHKLFSKKNRLVIILLASIIFFGTFLRFFRLNDAPKGALVDELHFGYLAHSLIKTGMDEHGNSWPIIFEGFGDRKLPAMAYLDIPTIGLLGLTVLAFRIPSALAGSLLILVSFWMILEITRRKKWALLGAFITAISPWSFFLSRFGFESNLALLGLSAGLASLFTAERTHNKNWYILSALGIAFSWYSYVAYRPITMVLIAVFALYKFFSNYKQDKQAFARDKKNLGIFVLSFALFVAPLFTPSAVSVNSTRFGQVGITTEAGTAQVIDEKRNFCANLMPRVLCDVAWNKPTYMIRELTHRYLLSFSPEFLVTKGELSTDFLTIDGFGQFFPVLYPLIIFGIAGILFLKRTKMTPMQKLLIVIGLLISPIPTAFVGEPQKVRISALYPFLLVTIVYGAIVFDQLLKKKLLKNLFMTFLVLTLFGYTFLYQMEYQGVHTTQHEFKYQSYLPSLHRYLNLLPDDAIINIIPFYSDPLMFHAFYTKMDPSVYQSLAVLDEYDGANFRHTVELGNIWAHKYSPEQLGCLALEKGVRGYYVTDKKLEYLDLDHTEKSSNGVNTYAYVYDVTGLMLERSCEEYKL